jgi:hypothetical protein
MNTFAEGIGFLACLIWVGGISYPAQTSHGTPKPKSHLMKVFSKAVPLILKKTSVPIRIPTEVPGLDREDDDLYAIVQSADETGYTIILGATPDCEGQHVCSYGTLIGTTRPFNEIADDGLTDRRKKRVILWNGISGYFYDSVCGAYCDDSLIVWTEGKYRYIIGLKAEKQSNMIKVANSAIRAGTGRWK